MVMVCVHKFGVVWNDIKQKPEIVHYYNSTKADVDIANQILQEHATSLWPCFIIFWIFVYWMRISLLKLRSRFSASF